MRLIAGGAGSRLAGFVLPPPVHQRLMTGHAEDALGCLCVFQILNLALAIPAFETLGAKGLFAGEDSEVFDLVLADGAAVGAIVADEGAIAEKEEVGVRVEEGATAVAAEAVNVPAITGCTWVSQGEYIVREDDATKLECFAFLKYLVNVRVGENCKLG